MPCLRTLFRATILLVVAAATAVAQHGKRPIVAAPGAPARIAGIAPPPPPPRAARIPFRDGFGGGVPTVLTADGLVFVNYGAGFQPVAPVCAYAYGYACPVYPFVAQPPVYAPSIYVAPVYAAPVYQAPEYNTPIYPAAGYSPTRGTPVPLEAGPAEPVPAAPRALAKCPAGMAPTGGKPACVPRAPAVNDSPTVFSRQ